MKKAIIFLFIGVAVLVGLSLYKVEAPAKFYYWAQFGGDMFPNWTEKWDLGKWNYWWDSSYVRVGKFKWVIADSGFYGASIDDSLTMFFRSDTIDTIVYGIDTIFLQARLLYSPLIYNEHYNVACGMDVDNMFIGGNSSNYKAQKRNADNNLLIDVIAVGYNAGENDSMGHSNIYVGPYTGSAMNGENNVFVGAGVCGRNILLGNYNTTIGNASLYHTIADTCYANTIVGANAGQNIKGDSNIVIGYGAGYNKIMRQTLFIENSQDTITPLIYGRFDSNYVRVNGALEAGDRFVAGSDSVAGKVVFAGASRVATYMPGLDVGDVCLVNLINSDEDVADVCVVNGRCKADSLIINTWTSVVLGAWSAFSLTDTVSYMIIRK